MSDTEETRARRELLGRLVRQAWLQWANGRPAPKPSWLLPWEALDESDKEVDRQIGEAILRAVSYECPSCKKTFYTETANADTIGWGSSARMELPELCRRCDADEQSREHRAAVAALILEHERVLAEARALVQDFKERRDLEAKGRQLAEERLETERSLRIRAEGEARAQAFREARAELGRLPLVTVLFGATGVYVDAKAVRDTIERLASSTSTAPTSDKP